MPITYKLEPKIEQDIEVKEYFVMMLFEGQREFEYLSREELKRRLTQRDEDGEFYYGENVQFLDRPPQAYEVMEQGFIPCRLFVICGPIVEKSEILGGEE